MVFMFSLLGWALVGAIVGFAASRVVNLHGDDPRLGIIACAVAALLGGWMYSWISGSPVVLFNPMTLLIAALAALATAIVWHVVRGRAPHDRPTVRRSY